MKRKAAVAGYFYPSEKEKLRTMLKQFIDVDKEKKKAVSVISPHAGYQYSGAVAGSVFSSVVLPNKFIILGPNHRSSRSGCALVKEGEWENPLGNVEIDSKLSETLMNLTSVLEYDEEAHIYEHSIEVQIPFIQYLKKNISIVPISISYFVSIDELEELGEAISKSIKEHEEDVLIVASTDMSHRIPQSIAQEKDYLAIEEILKLNERGLFEVVQKKEISMCGYQPVISAIVASKRLGAEKGELLTYQTSGDVTGNYQDVVGYAGICIC